MVYLSPYLHSLQNYTCEAELQRMAPECPVSTCSGVYHDSRVNSQGEYSDCVKVRWPSWRGGSIQQQYNTAVSSQHFCQ